MSRWKRYGMLGTPVDDRLRARRLLQRAEDPAVAPSRREMLPGDHRVPPAKPVAEHTCCLPHADGREPPIGKQGLPAGRQDASRNRSGVDRHRIWLAAAALICCAELTDHSEPQAMPELPELPLVQMGSVHHTPYMGPRCWWACYGSSSSSINSVICSLEEPSRSPKRRDQAALEASCLGPATRYQQLQPWPPIAPQAPEGSCADHLWYQPKLPVEAGSPGWPPPC